MGATSGGRLARRGAAQNARADQFGRRDAAVVEPQAARALSRCAALSDVRADRGLPVDLSGPRTCRSPSGIGRDRDPACRGAGGRSEEHTSELKSLMRISYAVLCLKKKNKIQKN